jgi:hypothetical protein
MAASNTRLNSLGQSKTPIDSDHGIYRDPPLTGSLLLAPPAPVGLRGVGRGYEVAPRRRAGG